jgi:hypothetical protein
MIDALEQASQSKQGSKQPSPSKPTNEEIDTKLKLIRNTDL